MATVIDMFAVELGLDATKFQRGQREATAEFKKTRESIQRDAGGVEVAVQKAADRLDLLGRNALRLFAIFTGGKALGQFAADVSRTDAAVGRLATSIGSTPDKIAAVANAVARSGGSADAASASIEGFVSNIEQLKATGDTAMLPFLNRLQAAGGRQINLNKDWSETLRDVSANLKAVADKQGISTATFYGKQLGLDAGTVALMVKGADAYEKLLEESRKIGVTTKEDADAAEKRLKAVSSLTQEFDSLGRTILTAVTPFMVQFLKDMQAIIRAVKEFVTVHIVPHLKDLGSAMGVAGDSTTTFMRAVEALFALWAGAKFLAFLRAIGTLRAVLLGGGGAGAAAARGGLFGGFLARLGIGGLAGAAALGHGFQTPAEAAANPDNDTLNREGIDRRARVRGYFGDIFKPDASDKRSFWQRIAPESLGGKAKEGAGGVASPTGSTAPAGLLDNIARAEGTAGPNGYNTSLGYGKYLPGGTEQDLTSKSLREILDLGNHMRRQPGNPNSSALGRYQITGSTLKDAAAGLGLDLEKTKFSAETQDQMAHWIARKQGLGAWEGFKTHPAERAAAQAALASTASTSSIANTKEVAGGFHPLGGGGRLTSDIGLRDHPLGGGTRMHKGIDLAAPAGTNVQAMAQGAISIGRSGDVTVKHGDGSSTTYRHVVPSVKEGDQVAAGQVIASLRANDPRSTGPHLHFEARNAKGGLMDPKALLGPRPAAEPKAALEMGAPKATQEAGELRGRAAWNGVPNAGAYAAATRQAHAALTTNIADNRASSSRTVTNSTTINGGVQVQTAATDASGIARDIEPAIKRRNFALAAQSGPA